MAFNFFKKKTADEVPETLQHKINLGKEQVNKICLTKGISDKAKVVLCLDYSGSMEYEYSSGRVQQVIEKALPIALQFDDDGTFEVLTFDTSVKWRADCSMNNVYNYVSKNISGGMGGTRYSNPIKEIVKKAPDNIPTYVIFITDGEPSDREESTVEIIKASDKPVFWKFVGVGSCEFDFLKKLDDMTGRTVDNADFFEVDNLDDITYESLMEEYPGWLDAIKSKGILKEGCGKFALTDHQGYE